MSQDTTLPPLPDSVAVAISAYGDERADDSPTALNHYRAALAAVREWGAAIAAQAQQAQGVPSRDDAIRVWRKHCRPFVAQLGNAPPSCVIDAMMELATAPQADHIADASKLVGQAQGVPASKEPHNSNDKEPRDPDSYPYLDARGDDRGQGLSSYWKWGYAAGWNDHKKHATRTAAPQAEPCDAGELCIGCSPRNADGSCPAAAPQAEPSQQATTKKPDRTGMTYYRNSACKAEGADSVDCICWTPKQAEPQPEREPLSDEVESVLREALIALSFCGKSTQARALSAQAARHIKAILD